MPDFVYTSLPSRVVFAAGALARLPDELALLGSQRAFVLSTPEQSQLAERAADLLGQRSAAIFARARMHVPVVIVREALAWAEANDVDCLVAIGGGSTIGLAKALARETGLPIIAVPTTYAGSEMTPIYGITTDGLKQTGRDFRVVPRTVLYDPDLTIGLPVRLSIVSGINAIAHAAEGLYARDGNPIMALLAEEGIRALASGLRVIHGNSADSDGRSSALYGAWLCGTVLGHVGMALHHKLCHTLGGSFDLPHAETHTIILPHALAYNASAAPDAMRRIARALGSDDAAGGVFALARSLGAPLALREIGMKEADLDRAVAIALADPYWNPRPLEAAPLRALLQRAWAGNEPQMDGPVDGGPA